MTLFKTVLITTSGIGSRLGDLTQFTNKCLVRVGEIPTISHIINSYSSDTNFVITLGYFGAQVKEYLELAHPNSIFQFVDVNNYDGVGSSLLYSILQSEQYLQKPFIYHASDTIVNESIKVDFSNNFIAGVSGKGSSVYASFSTRGNLVTDIHQKGYDRSDFLHIGLVGIYDFARFWEIAKRVYELDLNNSSLGDVDVIKKMILECQFELNMVYNWYDIGNLEALAKARANLGNASFHVLEKLAESIYKVDESVIKFFHDESILAKRVERTKYLKGLVPELTGVRNNFYKYDFVKGELFANVANRSNFIDLIKWAESKLWLDVEEFNQEDFNESCKDFYLTKTVSRINDFFIKKGLADKIDVINGEEIPTVVNLLKLIDPACLLNHKPSSFHGDFILDNILLVSKGDFKLIDWRQDFSGIVAYGDKYYDIAKLAHNLVVNHDLVDHDLFQLKYESNGDIVINIHRLQSLVECEGILFDYLKDHQYDVRKVEILRAIIWLNMSPLHHNPFDSFLFYFGKYNLFNVLKKYGKV